ncbi:DISARM system phospholipase D-like protein DrmC [Ancylothrix sp. D3o]|uniref:DISARM system phospholipase D-like protein DrmC n=1 Tax=Ancylothrix sp. D3o TaxID=2953691 RepID=UPI0021BB6073|nr:DISARM system phospholipase D-like protein DrmC [Ancylothrix sp. D3o]
MLSPQFMAQIRRVALELPTPTLESITNVLSSYQELGYSEGRLKAELFQRLPKASWRQTIAELLLLWHTENPNLDSSSLATALLTAAYCEQQNQEELSAEIVWTGPNVSSLPLRRTDQVLLQLIRDAQEDLLLISFAVYKVPEIAAALVDAINRGVNLRIIVETSDSDNAKIPFGIKTAFGAEIVSRAQVFVWPHEQRPTDSEGRFGSLHIKCLVVDSSDLFISSANLTEYALALNMEMGVLVHSKELAGQVIEHINGLIYQEILVLEKIG